MESAIYEIMPCQRIGFVGCFVVVLGNSATIYSYLLGVLIDLLIARAPHPNSLRDPRTPEPQAVRHHAD
jgi:hypothetical protein